MELAAKVASRGMTVIEWRAGKAAPNARVAMDPDAGAIRAQFHAALMDMTGGRDD